MNRRLTRSFLLVAFLFGFDKLVALTRQVLVARSFGVGSALDCYNAANNLPDLVFAVISGGAMAVAIVPVLTESLDRDGRAGMWDLFARLANWAFLLTAGLAAFLAVFSHALITRVVVPHFTAVNQATTESLMRLDLIALMIFSVSGLVIGCLQAQKHFLLPALAPVLYNVGQIFGVLVLVPHFGVYGLAYGTILGALLHLLIQVPGLLVRGFQWIPSLDLRAPGVWKAARLMGPRILTVAAIQAIFVTTDNFASGLGAGAITALAYGWLILQVPETIIGSALGTVLLPTLSELADRGADTELVRITRRALGVILLLTLPIVAIGIPAMSTAVRLIFEGRAFTADGTAMVTATARLFLLALPAHAAIETAVRAFYARQDAKTPLFTALITAGIFLVLCIVLTRSMGFAGIALANTLAFSTEALLLLGILRFQHMV